MTAKVVGIKKTDVTINGERIKSTKFNLVLDSEVNGLTGHDVDVLSWNELNLGEPPSIEVGNEIEVEYQKTGKLKFKSITKGNKAV
ncbi:MAG: hypothetical protein FWD38_09190 [Oscillospiraceae bacterium]|nr:hypothetical protein [Oscillospiraceae bacterium]